MAQAQAAGVLRAMAWFWQWLTSMWYAEEMWRLTETRMKAAEAAAVIGVICQYVDQNGLEVLDPISTADLSITCDGYVLILARPSRGALPVAEVLRRVLLDLLGLVDDEAPVLWGALSSLQSGEVIGASDVAELGRVVAGAYGLADSRLVLREVALRMGNPSASVHVPPVAVPVARSDEVPDEQPLLDEEREPSRSHADTPPSIARAPAVPSASRTLRLARVGLAAAAVIQLAIAAFAMLTLVRGQAEHRTPESPRSAADDTRPAVAAQKPPAPSDGMATRSAEARLVEAGEAAMAVAPEHPEPKTVPIATPGIEGPVFSPSFADGGAAIFFHAGRDPRATLVEGTLGETGELMTVRTLSRDAARDYHARLSPDGTQVAFDSDRDGERAVYVAARDGSGTRRVSGEGFGAVPSWSPDMRTLAFVRAESDRPHVWNLWLRNLESGELRRLTSYRIGQMWGASWFPDSVRVCYSHEDVLVIHDGRSGATTRYASPVPGRLVRTPAVSPDGTRIVFQVQRAGVWLLDLRDGSMRRILTDRSAEEFTWDPAGRRVAYHSRRDGQWRIWITSPTATDPG